MSKKDFDKALSNQKILDKSRYDNIKLNMGAAETGATEVDNPVAEPELIIHDRIHFDYEEAGIEIKQKHNLLKIRDDILSENREFQIKIGAYLTEARSVLGNQKSGIFNKWCEVELGIPTTTVYRILNRYELVMEAETDKIRELLKALPGRLVSYLASKNADQGLKDKILKGDITTGPELKEWKKRISDSTELLEDKKPKVSIQYATARKRFEEHKKDIVAWAEYYDIDTEKLNKAVFSLFDILFK